MGNLFIASTKKTPEIVFFQNGELQIKGSSIPEDAVSFYKPLLFWLDDFLTNQPASISVLIDFEYINTSSIVHLIKMLNLLITKTLQKESLKIVWKFDPEDDDSFEQGENIQKIVKHPFLFVKKLADNAI